MWTYSYLFINESLTFWWYIWFISINYTFASQVYFQIKFCTSYIQALSKVFHINKNYLYFISWTYVNLQEGHFHRSLCTNFKGIRLREFSTNYEIFVAYFSIMFMCYVLRKRCETLFLRFYDFARDCSLI